MIGSALLDTSVYIAREHDRPRLTDAPAQPVVSVIPVAELTAGVLTAPDQHSRIIRQATLDLALRTAPLPVESMGREMVRMLLTRIGGGTPEESLVILPTHLVVRDSA